MNDTKVSNDLLIAVMAHSARLETISMNIANHLPTYIGDLEDEEERFIIQQLHHLNYTYLEGFVSMITYLKRPIRRVGVLQKQANDRYAMDDRELSSGTAVELLIYDEEDGCFNWQVTRIEHSHKYGGYYAYHYPELELEGVKARIR